MTDAFGGAMVANKSATDDMWIKVGRCQQLVSTDDNTGRGVIQVPRTG